MNTLVKEGRRRRGGKLLTGKTEKRMRERERETEDDSREIKNVPQ